MLKIPFRLSLQRKNFLSIRWSFHKFITTENAATQTHWEGVNITSDLNKTKWAPTTYNKFYVNA